MLHAEAHKAACNKEAKAHYYFFFSACLCIVLFCIARIAFHLRPRNWNRADLSSHRLLVSSRVLYSFCLQMAAVAFPVIPTRAISYNSMSYSLQLTIYLMEVKQAAY